MRHSLKLIHDEPGRAITVESAGIELFRYVYAPDDPVLESPRPYLHPIRTIGGDVVSVFRPWDHVWHKGLSFAFPHVGTENFWGGPSYVHPDRYEQFDNNGTMRHIGFDRIDQGEHGCTIKHRLHWRTQDGRLLVEEHRALSAALGEDRSWALTIATTLRNVYGEPLHFGSPATKGRTGVGYGGLFWRGPRSFTGGHILTERATGGDEQMGVRAPWMAFAGQHDERDRTSTVVLVDDAGNAGHPTAWFARSSQFAAICAAPFAEAEQELRDGERLAFRYTVVIAEGGSDAGRCAQLVDGARRALDTEVVRAGA